MQFILQENFPNMAQRWWRSFSVSAQEPALVLLEARRPDGSGTRSSSGFEGPP